MYYKELRDEYNITNEEWGLLIDLFKSLATIATENYK